MRLDGRACRLAKNDAAYYSMALEEGLVPWNGDASTLIDRFDVRALLDAYVQPESRRVAERGVARRWGEGTSAFWMGSGVVMHGVLTRGVGAWCLGEHALDMHAGERGRGSVAWPRHKLFAPLTPTPLILPLRVGHVQRGVPPAA